MFGQNGKRDEDFQFVCSATKSSIEFQLAPSSLLRKLASVSGCPKVWQRTQGSAYDATQPLFKKIKY